MVLAGGASRRMGRDKATLRHPDGPTMVQRTAAVVAERCAPVFVVAAAGQDLPDLAGARVLRDTVPGLGPLPATGLGLAAAAAAGCGRAFVCAVDMPALSADLIDELAAAPAAEVVLAFDGREHYLAAIYRTELAGSIQALVAAGERRMRSLTGVARTRRIRPTDPDALRNVNTAGDCTP